MSKNHGGGSSQGELFARSKKPLMSIEANHRLVQLADRLDWTELEQLVQQVRKTKLKNLAGRKPHLRPLIGAVLMMASRRMGYREAEDQIRHYAPARYLCGLTESDWTPDFTTIQDFTELMGEDGLSLINQYAVKWAVKEKLADPKLIVADTTAQEANIPYPNEMGLMAAFMASLAVASKGAGRLLAGFSETLKGKVDAAKKMVRKYRLFSKTKEAKDKMTAAMATLCSTVQSKLKGALKQASPAKDKLVGRGKASFRKIEKMHETMNKLVPQIRYWLRTGYVASGKIISIHVPELYSVVRGKIGKTVEFGLNWGITRLRGGFLIATLGKDRAELHDSKFAIRAVDDHVALFGRPPVAYAYDRGGHNAANVATLKSKGVKEVGLAPKGRTQWAVSAKVREKLVRERAQVEAGIGTIKCSKYGFNRPAARSAAMMGACGQRAVLGFNLTKLIRQLAMKEEMVLVG